MCGIIGCVDERGGAVRMLLDGLEHLEYRGYDSAGVAIGTGRDPVVTKREGEIEELRAKVDETQAANVGIAHTRWSTHGPPTEANAHPHTDCTGAVAVVHNGIIDNYQSLRSRLQAVGHEFTSETDTEVVPHLIEAELAAGAPPEQAFRAAVDQLSGSYAIAALIGDGEVVYATRSGSPLIIGVGSGHRFVASDVPAFLPYTDRVVYVKDDEFVRMTSGGVELTDSEGDDIDRSIDRVDWDPENTGLGGYDHFMAKEIHEQPTALRKAIRGRVNSQGVTLEGFEPGTFADVSSIHLVGMGTSYHAALYGEILLNGAGVRARSALASMYATLRPPVDEETLVVAVTQSGETADTLKAVRWAADAGARTLAVTNVVGSTVTRECDDAVFIRAGPEIGVAATKTFSSQVTMLAMLTEVVATDLSNRGNGSFARRREALSNLPEDVQEILDTSNAEAIARRYHGSDTCFFTGRWVGVPAALEGALKFKEITYEHAEGFTGAEFKHGPLALVTERTPVFAIVTEVEREAMIGNIREVQARGAPVIAVVSPDFEEVRSLADDVLLFPRSHSDVAGILANVQLQLVAYHAADLLGRRIDKPRNLAKSVTVE